MSHLGLIHDRLFALQEVVSGITTGGRADRIDEPHAHDCLRLTATGKIHRIDITGSFQCFLISLALTVVAKAGRLEHRERRRVDAPEAAR